MILRKLGPSTDAARCQGGYNCPNLFELSTGDFAVVGRDITLKAAPWLPLDAGCGPEERIVSVPRRTLVLARPDIPVTI